MTITGSSYAFSFSYNYNNQNSYANQNFNQCAPQGNDQMANMLQGFGMIFAGMDILDNGQMDGSILKAMTGIDNGQQNQQYMPQQQQNPYQQQNNPYNNQQNQNPMMQMLMQMMAMLFAMFDKMDDGQVNGSVFQNMFGQNGNQNVNNQNGAFAYAGPNGAYASAGGNQAYASNGNNNVNSTYPGLFNNDAGQIDGINSGPAGVYGGVKLNQEQMNNARIIAEVGMQKGASKRDVQIAIATAMQESQLKNINYGDRDSLGLFQQRPSCGWGSREQIMNPRYAAGKFFDALLKDKNRNGKSLTRAAQDVQRSAFPNAYAKWESMAASVTNTVVS